MGSSFSSSSGSQSWPKDPCNRPRVLRRDFARALERRASPVRLPPSRRFRNRACRERVVILVLGFVFWFVSSLPFRLLDGTPYNARGVPRRSKWQKNFLKDWSDLHAVLGAHQSLVGDPVRPI